MDDHKLSVGQLRHYVERGCTSEAIIRFAARYREYCHFKPDGTPKRVVPRLKLAVTLAKQGKAVELPGAHRGRRIFDVEMPADIHFPAFTLRILTNADASCVLTCLPFRPKVKWYKETTVTLPPPVKATTSLGDLLRRKQLECQSG
jgi:hypothetical protein